MNFADFQTFRAKLLAERRDLHDCAETNLYRALARLVPPPTPAPSATVHRCHLAGEWCERFGFAPETSRRALISCGVRDSLALLFHHYAEENARLWLPSDNYPVYGELARAAGLAPREFPTLPAPQWPDAAPCDGVELLVITNPLKPLGRHLDDSDVAALERWLAASPRRRVLLDAVYTFGTLFAAATLRLLATGQVTLLHSLTKGWLHPRLFGIALVPQADATALASVFRASAPPQLNLARARECLGMYVGTPAAVANALDAAQQAMMDRAAAAGALDLIWATSGGSRHRLISNGPPGLAASYFFPVIQNWRALLETHGILGIPASAFGSARDDITILSSLAFAR